MKLNEKSALFAAAIFVIGLAISAPGFLLWLLGKVFGFAIVSDGLATFFVGCIFSSVMGIIIFTIAWKSRE